MTDHDLTHEVSDGSEVDEDCVRVVCTCGWQGVWMTPTMPNAEGVERPTTEYVPVLVESLRGTHPSEDPVDREEELYQRVLARLRKDGHI